MHKTNDANTERQVKRRKLIRLEFIRTVRFGRRTDRWLEKVARGGKTSVTAYIRHTMDALCVAKTKN